MTSVVGKLQPFKPENERFSTYVERLLLYFETNSVPCEKRVPVFLIVLNHKMYGLLSDHFAPAKPKEKDLDDLITVLKLHFEPKPIPIAERYAFYKRDQVPGESLSDYAVELRRLAFNCKFGQYLPEALRDRFVCGLCSEPVQKELLRKKDLTLTDAIKLAQSLSSADKTTHAIHAGRAPDSAAVTISSTVNVVSNTGSSTKCPCYRCGQTGHLSDQC